MNYYINLLHYYKYCTVSQNTRPTTLLYFFQIMHEKSETFRGISFLVKIKHLGFYYIFLFASLHCKNNSLALKYVFIVDKRSKMNKNLKIDLVLNIYSNNKDILNTLAAQNEYFFNIVC